MILKPTFAKGVLEESSDVLVNVNILEDEHAARNIDRRRKKTDYDPYEEMDEEVGFCIL